MVHNIGSGEGRLDMHAELARQMNVVPTKATSCMCNFIDGVFVYVFIYILISA